MCTQTSCSRSPPVRATISAAPRLRNCHGQTEIDGLRQMGVTTVRNCCERTATRKDAVRKAMTGTADCSRKRGNSWRAPAVQRRIDGPRREGRVLVSRPYRVSNQFHARAMDTNCYPTMEAPCGSMGSMKIGHGCGGHLLGVEWK